MSGWGVNHTCNTSLVEFSWNLCFTDSWNGNLKPESHEAAGITEVLWKFYISSISSKILLFMVLQILQKLRWDRNRCYRVACTCSLLVTIVNLTQIISCPQSKCIWHGDALDAYILSTYFLRCLYFVRVLS